MPSKLNLFLKSKTQQRESLHSKGLFRSTFFFNIYFKTIQMTHGWTGNCYLLHRYNFTLDTRTWWTKRISSGIYIMAYIPCTALNTKICTTEIPEDWTWEALFTQVLFLSQNSGLATYIVHGGLTAECYSYVTISVSLQQNCCIKPISMKI